MTAQSVTNCIMAGSAISNWEDVYGISTDNCVAYTTSSKISSLESTVEAITKKPEVRADQRSSLKIGRQVSAYYYENGFRTNSKDLIPAIKSIEVFNENTIKMTFVNGDVQKVTAQNGDVFSFEDGIVRCIAKEMIGKEGSSILNKLVSYATKVYNDAEADKKKKAEEEEKKRIASEKNYKKAKKHWAKKRAKERENRIQEMAEAIVRAKEMEKK
jgi:hypothetical protein